MSNMGTPFWAQYKVRLPALPRGCHLITSVVEEQAAALPDIAAGMLNVFLQHTSASLSINENADPDVRADMETALNAISPEQGLPYRHTLEGPDDMAAHVKSSLLGCSLMVPVHQGRLALGTWQGIYLCEHRNRGGSRRLLLTLFGQQG